MFTRRSTLCLCLSAFLISLSGCGGVVAGGALGFVTGANISQKYKEAKEKKETKEKKKALSAPDSGGTEEKK